MKLVTTISAEFDAAHKLPELFRCSRIHGHRYRVAVACGGDVDTVRFSTELGSIVQELQFRDLNEMLVGVVPDPSGIANWFMERLLMNWDKLISVEVWESPNYSVRVVREVH